MTLQYACTGPLSQSLVLPNRDSELSEGGSYHSCTQKSASPVYLGLAALGMFMYLGLAALGTF